MRAMRSAEGLSIDELHGEELEFAEVRFGGVEFVNLADVEAAHLTGGARLGGQTLAETGAGGFERHAPLEFFVVGLVDDAHSAAADFADDAEASGEVFAGIEAAIQGAEVMDHGVAQEGAHPLLPLDALLDLGADLGIGARGVQEIRAGLFRQMEGTVEQRHHEFIALAFVLHCAGFSLS